MNAKEEKSFLMAQIVQSVSLTTQERLFGVRGPVTALINSTRFGRAAYVRIEVGLRCRSSEQSRRRKEFGELKTCNSSGVKKTEGSLPSELCKRLALFHRPPPRPAKSQPPRVLYFLAREAISVPGE